MISDKEIRDRIGLLEKEIARIVGLIDSEQMKMDSESDRFAKEKIRQQKMIYCNQLGFVNSQWAELKWVLEE